MNSQTKTCQNCKQDFTIEPDDFAFYEKIDVPPPTWCPECRLIRRMVWRNERSLYKRECDLCGKSIISVYTKILPLIVYCRDCWNSDKWDGKLYGHEYNWNKNFFVQFKELLWKTPLVYTDSKGTNVNSDYGSYNGNCKNCYLCFSVVSGEDCLYCSNSQDLKQCLDCMSVSSSELLYEGQDSEKNYGCAFIEKTRESANSYFLFACSGANDCFMSSNLKNKSYVFRNEQLNKNEYRAKIKEINFGSFETIKKLKEEFLRLKSTTFHRYAEIRNSTACSGDNIINSKRATYSFQVNESEEIKYCFRILKGSRDVYDCHGMAMGELVYEGVGCGYSPRGGAFCLSLDVSRNLKYCAVCRDCADCFGCVGLKNQQYCILNKQYTKEEYEKLVPKIIQYMNEMPYVDKEGRVYKYGEFFPPELSPFCYNETIAQEYFSLTEEQATEQGYKWKNPEEKNYKIDIKSENLPEHIKNAEKSIVGKVIECAHKGECNHQCTKAFKIIKEELQFYQKMNLPLPRLCPNCRHYERLKQRNPLKLWHRQCMCEVKNHGHNKKCPNEFETSYAPDRPEIVYCESCYQQEVA